MSQDESTAVERTVYMWLHLFEPWFQWLITKWPHFKRLCHDHILDAYKCTCVENYRVALMDSSTTVNQDKL